MGLRFFAAGSVGGTFELRGRGLLDNLLRLGCLTPDPGKLCWAGKPDTACIRCA